MTASEAALIERAQSGDREAFAELYEPLEGPLAAFLYRLTAARQDADDLAQETAVRTLETIGAFGGASTFRAWIFALAVEAALDYLRGRRPWDPDAQIRAGRKAGEDSAAGRRLRQMHKSRLHTMYDIGEHIDFCFTAMGRCLPPHEQAALLLVEVHGFTPEEAAATLGITGQAMAFRLRQAREALAAHFDERCSLINRNGLCSQCAGLDTLFYKDRRHTELALFQIRLQPQATPAERAATLAERLAIVRSLDPLRAAGLRLHDALMNLIRDVNGYK